MELHGLRQPNSDSEPMVMKKMYFEVLVGIFILGSPKLKKGCFTKRMPACMSECLYVCSDEN